MKYKRTTTGIFEDRPNRFIAHVWIDGVLETVHVKNTGRCKELLYQGVQVVLEIADNPNRKTGWDLVSVYKKDFGWINIDSQAPNKVMEEWLATQGFDVIRPEYTYGDSRIDFYLERGEKKILVEVKGCTLEIDGIGYFPDAPTTRGIKHMKELARGLKDGYETAIAFVIPMNGITQVLPNRETHPAFGEVLDEVRREGVALWCLPCDVTEDSVKIRELLIK